MFVFNGVKEQRFPPPAAFWVHLVHAAWRRVLSRGGNLGWGSAFFKGRLTACCWEVCLAAELRWKMLN